MLKKILTVQTPFQNLKLITMIIKIFGLLSCKLVKGRLKPSASGRCYCALWILIHCVYTGTFYYETYIALLEKDAKQKFIIFETVRFTIFVASIIPYNYVACFQEQEFIKFSDKLEMYDDKARALGHERKDKHIFIWLYFIITGCDLSRRTYDILSANIADGAIQKMIEDIIPAAIGTYDIFITGQY
ncbi:uncharacterized protein LOC109609797 isoform X2 [Camponotus floridanus]|uniref:uncharacterized protein LOC109609797 isoform X2 n=1 Tax=Camponotus floridanus TaxID=104421 RepID=UPI000DC67CB2|nr:uncharacterized protein LOC109609797 isoform X2 [Camponotus floridanus]